MASEALELTEEPSVVFEEQPDLRNPVANHGDSLEPHAEREARHLLGIVAHRAKHVGVHHPRPQQLEPAPAAAHAAAPAALARLHDALPVAHRTRSVHLTPGLDE